jgi:SynChlorMet cassette protein ScmD
VSDRVLDKDNPVANPIVVLREEFDDWAVLFDPDTGNAFGLNPVGVFIWKRLDGRHTIEDIQKELHQNCESVPKNANIHLKDFIQSLVDQGLAGYEAQKA